MEKLRDKLTREKEKMIEKAKIDAEVAARETIEREKARLAREAN